MFHLRTLKASFPSVFTKSYDLRELKVEIRLLCADNNFLKIMTSTNREAIYRVADSTTPPQSEKNKQHKNKKCEERNKSNDEILKLKKKGKKSQNVKTTSKSIKIQIEMGQNGGMQERVLFKKNQA